MDIELLGKACTCQYLSYNERRETCHGPNCQSNRCPHHRSSYSVYRKHNQTASKAVHHPRQPRDFEMEAALSVLYLVYGRYSGVLQSERRPSSMSQHQDQSQGCRRRPLSWKGHRETDVQRTLVSYCYSQRRSISPA